MQFTSLLFLLFFCAVFFIYWLTPTSKRWAVALAASVLFYGLFGVGFLVLLFVGICVCYFGGLQIEKAKSKPVFITSLVLALLPLLFFKYYNAFFTAYLNGVFANAGLSFAFPSFILLTPVGLSFYTFKIISYLADIYTGKLVARTHFGHVALYVSFFPEISSGPIQRATNLLPQIEIPVNTFSYDKALGGAQLFLWGLFKKMVLADNFAYYINLTFSDINKVMGLSVIFAAFFYSIQLYCDFSAYSDMAIGLMNLLGFDVPENFKSPYFATSIRDFWGRWHISLSSFLRDYIYIPLGGSRKGTVRKYVNILITFLVSGLWHGTGFTFLVWGALHGIYQIVGDITRPVRDKLWQLAHLSQEGLFAKVWKTTITFLLVTVAWLVFRAGSLAEVWTLLSYMLQDFSLSLQSIKNAAVMMGLSRPVLIYLGLATGILFLVDLFAKETGFVPWLQKQTKWFQVAFCYLLMFLFLFYGNTGQGITFIYFAF